MTEPKRSGDAYYDASTWAHRHTRSEMTTGEADAWRAGRDACIAELRAIANRMLAQKEPVLWAAAHYENAALALARLEPRGEETGLCGRGA